MANHFEIKDYVLVCTVVNFGLGSKVLHIAKQCGISGGTILLGKGTVNNRILELLALSDVKKEIVLMVSDLQTADQALHELDKELKFEKPNHGIAFTISVCDVMGYSGRKPQNTKEERRIGNTMYHAIIVIVDKGKAEYVIDAATKMGSKGGTIINARGSGIHETQKLFSMDIEPEKEMVLILSQKDKTEAIASLIREELKIDEPGNGIIFIQDVTKTYGLYE